MTSSRRLIRGAWGGSRFQRETSEHTGRESENLRSQPRLGCHCRFPAGCVAEDAALFVDVILFGSLQFLSHVNGHNRQRNQLRVGVLERGAGCFSVVLEEE